LSERPRAKFGGARGEVVVSCAVGVPASVASSAGVVRSVRTPPLFAPSGSVHTTF